MDSAALFPDLEYSCISKCLKGMSSESSWRTWLEMKKPEYELASSSSQVELDSAFQVLNALKYTPIFLLQIKVIIDTELLYGTDPPSNRS
ncbi:hypothetical protein CapIbe_015790 [Capra ibex]